MKKINWYSIINPIAGMALSVISLIYLDANLWISIFLIGIWGLLLVWYIHLEFFNENWSKYRHSEINWIHKFGLGFFVGFGLVLILMSMAMLGDEANVFFTGGVLFILFGYTDYLSRKFNEENSYKRVRRIHEDTTRNQ